MLHDIIGGCRGPDPSPRPEFVIRNAHVLDGTGSPAFRADLSVHGDRILQIGSVTAAGAEEIDGSGLYLAPGFIDVHTHDDGALLVSPDMMPKVSQGVTTVVTGNCGVSLAPLQLQGDLPPPLDLIGTPKQFTFSSSADYARAVENTETTLNAAFMVGHGTLRCAVMDNTGRKADPRETAAMRSLVEEALEAGAVGFSSGLAYDIGREAPESELVELVRPLADTGAVYTTHMRNEGDDVEQSLDETLRTARKAGVPLVVSHHKCTGRKNVGRSRRTLAKIADARNTMDVHVDVYPYDAGSTVLIPKFAAIAKRTIISWSEPHPEVAGRDLSDIAAEWGVAEDTAVERLNPAGAVYFSMDESDVRRILAAPFAMIGSDGLPNRPNPHPRLWGAFPRVIRRYVRELAVLSLEDAVRKMTALPASVFNFVDRGVLRPGAYADLVLFDANRISDQATYERPEVPAQGIELVLVNGVPVYRHGRLTGSRPGRLLRR